VSNAAPAVRVESSSIIATRDAKWPIAAVLTSLTRRSLHSAHRIDLQLRIWRA
jgi:hypothetical protein